MRERSVLVGLGYAAAPAAGAAVILVDGVRLLPFAAAAAVVVGHVVMLRGSIGRSVPLTLAVLTAVALLEAGSRMTVIAVALIGIPCGMAVARIVHGERVADEMQRAEPFALLGLCAVYVPLDLVAPDGTALGTRALHLAVVMAAAATWHVAGAAASAFWNERRRWVSARLLYRRRVAEWPPVVVLFVAGAMFSEAHPVVGWWAVVIAALPYLFSHMSLNRLQAIRSTYRQTIRALGRLPEAGGFVVRGHAARTADLAVATGAELGFGATQSDRLEYAAFLHELGRVVLADRAVTAAGYTATDVASWSAAIIGEARYLEPVSEIVASYPQPYRRHGERRDGGLPRSSMVLKTASAFDDAIERGLDPLDALEELYMGAAYEHDPEVVGALRRVLERRGAIPE